MKKILVLCTGNSCRSQIAEGYLRHFAGNRAEVYSAGIETHGVNPKAVQVMAEDGIDLAGHTSNNILEYAGMQVDYIITVCDHANENCPYFPAAAQRFHQNFPDPAKATGTETDIMTTFREVRDTIKAYARTFIAEQLNPDGKI
jgi:arsenate reductase